MVSPEGRRGRKVRGRGREGGREGGKRGRKEREEGKGGRGREGGRGGRGKRGGEGGICLHHNTSWLTWSAQRDPRMRLCMVVCGLFQE